MSEKAENPFTMVGAQDAAACVGDACEFTPAVGAEEPGTTSSAVTAVAPDLPS